MISESDILELTDEQRKALVQLMSKVEEGITILGKRDVPGRNPGFYEKLAKTGEGGPMRRGYRSSLNDNPYYDLV